MNQVLGISKILPWNSGRKHLNESLPKAYQWFGSTEGNLSDLLFLIKTRFFSNQTNLGAPVFWKKDFGGPVRTPPSTAAPDQPLARPSGWFPPIIEVSLRDGNPIEENDQILIANGLLRHGWGSRVFSRPIYPPPKKRNMLISIENVQFLLAWIWIASFLWWEVYFGMQWLIRQLCHVKELLDESVPHKVLNTRTTYPLHLVVSKTSWIWLAKNWPPTNTPCKDPIWTDGSSSILPRKDWGRRPICWLEDWVCTPWNLP